MIYQLVPITQRQILWSHLKKSSETGWYFAIIRGRSSQSCRQSCTSGWARTYQMFNLSSLFFNSSHIFIFFLQFRPHYGLPSRRATKRVGTGYHQSPVSTYYPYIIRKERKADTEFGFLLQWNVSFFNYFYHEVCFNMFGLSANPDLQLELCFQLSDICFNLHSIRSILSISDSKCGHCDWYWNTFDTKWNK